MKRSDIASVLRLTVLAVILLLGDCQKYDTEIELAVVDKSCNSLTVMWTPIPEAQAYRLQYKPKLQPGNWKKVYTNETMFNITQLLPRTRYTVRVTKQGNQFFVRAVFRTLPRTDITDNVTVMASTNSLGIENKLTDAKITCWISGSDTVKNITILGMSREVVDGLSPNTTYSVDCVEVDEEGQYQCMEYNGTVTTLLEESPTVPGQPTNIAVNKTCNSLTLSWLPPGEDGGSIVTDYNVTVVNGSEDGPLLSVPAGGNTTVSITSLKPNTTYTVHIRAKNSAGLGPPAVKSVTTEEASPPLTVTSRSARVVSILPVANSASKSVDRCTLTAHYTFNTSESGGLYRVAFYTTSQGLNISSLLPDTAYSLVCTALLPVHGCTSSFTQFTFKTLPWVTPQVRVGNSFLQNNHLHQSISWSRPPHHTSQLHYIVKYGPSSVVDRPTHPSVSTTTSSNTTVILTLPIPTTPVVYNVWVAAVSDVGQGEYSQRKQVHYTTPLTAPTPIILVNRTCNAITLEWGAPPSTGGLPVLKYTLKISDNLQHSYTNVTSPSATLCQMEPNTKYALAVRAVNFIGNSEWTESVMVTTLKRDGQSIQILKVTPNEIQVSINRRGNKHDYNCTIKGTDKIIALSISDGVTFTIPNLSPNTTYDIDCIGAEDQCLEVNITVTTTATVPGEPTNAIVSQTTHNSAQLKWSAPLQNGGSEIIGYKITFTSLKHSGFYIIGVINTWKLVGLVPDSKYNIEISAINGVGIGAPANLTVKTSATATHIFPRNIVERGRDTVNVTVSGHGTKVQCDLRDSGQEHSTNTSILLPGDSSVFPLLSRGTDHTLYCTNKGTQCTGLELTVTVPSCP